MNLGHAVLLGLLQGLTEFLPVSSSGHLALAQLLIPGFDQPGVVFDALLHVGTALAVLLFERKQLVRWATAPEGWRLLLLLLVGTAATAAVAFPIRDLATGAFESAASVGGFLLLTAGILMVSRFLGGASSGPAGTGWRQTVVIGLAQGLAVFPGISRSGLTITVALGAGLERSWAARFSFLLGVPAILGATAAELISVREELLLVPASFWVASLAGGLVATASGYVALKIVLRTVASEVFHRFAWYCAPVGALVLAVGLWRG